MRKFIFPIIMVLFIIVSWILVLSRTEVEDKYSHPIFNMEATIDEESNTIYWSGKHS